MTPAHPYPHTQTLTSSLCMQDIKNLMAVAPFEQSGVALQASQSSQWRSFNVLRASVRPMGFNWSLQRRVDPHHSKPSQRDASDGTSLNPKGLNNSTTEVRRVAPRLFLSSEGHALLEGSGDLDDHSSRDHIHECIAYAEYNLRRYG